MSLVPAAYQKLNLTWLTAEELTTFFSERVMAALGLEAGTNLGEITSFQEDALVISTFQAELREYRLGNRRIDRVDQPSA